MISRQPKPEWLCLKMRPFGSKNLRIRMSAVAVSSWRGPYAHSASAIEGKVCLDVGSSTGGFTQCLLLKGAARVYALDVDVSQLDWKVRNDARVRPVELNARFLEPAHIGEAVDLVTIDASFISLTMLLPRIPAVLKPGGQCIALVKPQFEVGRGHVGKGGIVRDPQLQQEAVNKVVEAARSAGLEFVATHESPITGREGNREFFVFAG